MTGLNLGVLSYMLELDANPFEKSLKNSTSTASRAGDAMTKGLTLPLAGVAVAAGKLSLDFEKVFSRMEGLAGVAAGEVDGLKESVLGLAGETGKAPQELAEALYFIRSAGLSGQQALDALEYSAKGAAAGLGSTVDVADAVTSAMNAYAAEGLSAAAATDALVAAAEIGKVEAAQLAPQLGRLAGTAASLGIGFEDLAGTVAFLSRTNGDASLSATQMQGALNKLLTAGEKGKDTLDAIGLSMAEFRRVADKDGVPAALELLRKKLEAAGLEFSDFSEDQQFVQAALALTGKNFKAAQAAVDQARGSVGKTDDAFKKWSETAGFTNTQAFAKLQVALIQLGDLIVPLAADVAAFASKFFEVFSAMPEPVKQLALVLGMVAAAAGPVLSVAGRLYTTWKKVTDVISGLKVAFPQAEGAITRTGKAAGIAAKGGAALLVAYTGLSWFADQRAKRTGKALEEMIPDLDSSNLTSVQTALATLRRELDELDDREGKGKLLEVGPVKLFRTNGDADRDDKLEGTRKKIAELEEQEKTLTTATILGTGATKAQADAMGDNAEATALNVTELQKYIDKLSALYDPIFAMQDALAGEAEAQANLARVQGDSESTAADLAAAEQELFRAIVETDGAALRLQQSIETGATSLQAAAGQLDNWVASGRLTREQADNIATSIGIATSKAEEFVGTYSATLAMDDAELDEAIRKAGILMDRLRTVSNGRISIWGYGGGKPAPERASGGPVWPGQDFWVGENGPELVRFSSTGQVFDAATSRAMATRPNVAPAQHAMTGGGGGAGAGPTYISVPIAFHGNAGNRQDRDQLRRMVRDATEEAQRRSGSRPRTRYRQ